MDAVDARAKCWSLRKQAATSLTLDRQIALAQLEVQAEILGQLEEINKVSKRIAVLNIEELALRLEDFFRKTED